MDVDINLFNNSENLDISCYSLFNRKEEKRIYIRWENKHMGE